MDIGSPLRLCSFATAAPELEMRITLPRRSERLRQELGELVAAGPDPTLGLRLLEIAECHQILNPRRSFVVRDDEAKRASLDLPDRKVGMAPPGEIEHTHGLRSVLPENGVDRGEPLCEELEVSHRHALRIPKDDLVAWEGREVVNVEAEQAGVGAHVLENAAALFGDAGEHHLCAGRHERRRGRQPHVARDQMGPIDGEAEVAGNVTIEAKDLDAAAGDRDRMELGIDFAIEWSSGS